MKWLLMIILFTAEGEKPAMEPRAYPSEAECRAAAEEFVAHHPQFELVPGPDRTKATHPVLRSYVECVPENPEARKEGFSAVS